MDRFLQVTGQSNHHLPGSPSNSFIADEVASICPLITPSPPTNDLITPLPDQEAPQFTIGDELATILQHVQENKDGLDSASSSSSALAEPSCATLLNHRNTYHHITKTEDTVQEETAGKVQPMQLTFRNPTENYFFMSWNWPLLRKLSLWLFLSALVAMTALVVAMISSLPRTCNPHTEWYQGGVLYEIFPASFDDSNHDMIGDFRGIAAKTDYIRTLGVRAIRLNSIFRTHHYPEDYRNATTLLEIAPSLGDLTSFQYLVRKLRENNISLILDLPIHPVVQQLSYTKSMDGANSTNLEPSVEFLRIDVVQEALLYWISHGVAGFYLKNLEHFADDANLGRSLQKWKRTIGPDRPLIISHAIIENSKRSVLATILNNVDLVDVRLEVEKGVEAVSKQLEELQNSTLFRKAGMPWVHWSLSDDNSKRLADLVPFGNGTLGATLLQLMLPGTPSIFYGNEIGLSLPADPSHQELIRHLPPMAWPGKTVKVLSWNHHPELVQANFRQMALVAKMIGIRRESPSIYENSVLKKGDNRANAEVKYSRSDLLVIQRWYPRRKLYVVASNLGNRRVSADLSTMLYSGTVLIGPTTDAEPETVSFKNLTLWPGESVVILLD